MNIELTKEQFITLLKMAYLGNWMANAIRTQDFDEAFNEVEQLMLKRAEEAGMSEYVVKDANTGRLALSPECEDSDAREYINTYDEHVFWEELIARLVEREMVATFGSVAVQAMTPVERLTKEEPFVQRLSQEFADYGIDRFKIVTAK